MSSMRTALGRVRGHGAGGGTDHFVAQRVSAIALLVLSLWFVLAVALTMPAPTFLAASDFLQAPLNAVGVLLLVVIGLYHMAIGMQEIIIDYIGKPFSKAALLVLNTFACGALGVGAVYAVLYMNFGA